MAGSADVSPASSLNFMLSLPSGTISHTPGYLSSVDDRAKLEHLYQKKGLQLAAIKAALQGEQEDEFSDEALTGVHNLWQAHELQVAVLIKEIKDLKEKIEAHGTGAQLVLANLARTSQEPSPAELQNKVKEQAETINNLKIELEKSRSREALNTMHGAEGSSSKATSEKGASERPDCGDSVTSA